MKTANEYFKQVLKVRKDLLSHSEDADSKIYYQKEELFKIMLKDLLKRDDLLKLSKNNLIQFLSLCSTYRPREPYLVLQEFSMKWTELEDKRMTK